MTIHQWTVIGLWSVLALFFLFVLVDGLGQIFGYANVLGMLVGALLWRVAPLALVGYSIWAFVS